MQTETLVGTQTQELQWIRNAVGWITKHVWISSLGALLVIAGVLAVQLVLNRTRGTLSDPVHRGLIVDAVYGIGTVTATRSYSIKPGVTSTLRDSFVKEGDFVRKGDRLLTLDTVIYRAPFNGTVNYLPFKLGENVFAQLPSLVLTDLSNRYLVVTLEQQGALRVRSGQKAKLSFDSIRQQNYDGVVESVYSYNTCFLARINVSNLPAEILPDMTADVAIVIREVKNALVIPVNAFENGTVWRKRGQMIPSQTDVKLGVVDGASAEVLSGDVQEGDRLMIHGKL